MKLYYNQREQVLGNFFRRRKKTNVFCIATCRARKPKLKNVVFYNILKEALSDGFRLWGAESNKKETEYIIKKATRTITK